MDHAFPPGLKESLLERFIMRAGPIERVNAPEAGIFAYQMRLREDDSDLDVWLAIDPLRGLLDIVSKRHPPGYLSMRDRANDQFYLEYGREMQEAFTACERDHVQRCNARMSALVSRARDACKRIFSHG